MPFLNGTTRMDLTKKFEFDQQINYSVIQLPETLYETPNKFTSQVYQNNRIYFLPFNSPYLLILDLTTNQFTSVFISSLTGKWYGQVQYDKYIFGIPHNSNSVLRVDTQDNTYSFIPLTGISGIQKWSRQVVYNDKIYMSPYNHTHLQEFDIQTNTMTLYEIPIFKDVPKKFSDVVVVKDRLFLIPYDYPYLLVFNLKSKSFEYTMGPFSYTGRWLRQTYIPELDMIVQFPYQSNSLLIVNPNTFEFKEKVIQSSHTFGFSSFQYIDSYSTLVGIPQYSSSFVTVDSFISDNYRIQYYHELETDFKWYDCVKVGEYVYTVPYDQNYLVKLRLVKRYGYYINSSNDITTYHKEDYKVDDKLNIYLDGEFKRKQQKVIQYSDDQFYNQIWDVTKELDELKIEKQSWVPRKSYKRYNLSELEKIGTTVYIKTDKINVNESQMQVELFEEIFDLSRTDSDLTTFVINSSKTTDRQKTVELYLVNEDDNRIVSDIVLDVRDLTYVLDNSWFRISLDKKKWWTLPFNLGEIKGYGFIKFYLRCTIPYKFVPTSRLYPLLKNFVLTLQYSELPNN